MKFFLTIALTGLFVLSSGWVNYSPVSFSKVSLEMELRTANNGQNSKFNARIYYSFDGKMVTYYDYPKEYVLLNNAKGDIKIYNKEENSIVQRQNFLYSTESTQLYYFLQNKKGDLGLSDMGFIQSNVRFEEGLLVTEWLPHANMAAKLSKVELVHEKNDPIYIAYYDSEGNIGTKSYFYNYQRVNGDLNFPTTVTQISYTTPMDSSITKITYNNIRFDNQVNDSFFDFKIPDNAKAIE